MQEEGAVLLVLQHDRGWGGRDGAGHEGAAPGGVAGTCRMALTSACNARRSGEPLPTIACFCP